MSSRRRAARTRIATFDLFIATPHCWCDARSLLAPAHLSKLQSRKSLFDGDHANALLPRCSYGMTPSIASSSSPASLRFKPSATSNLPAGLIHQTENRNTWNGLPINICRLTRTAAIRHERQGLAPGSPRLLLRKFAVRNLCNNAVQMGDGVCLRGLLRQKFGDEPRRDREGVKNQDHEPNTAFFPRHFGSGSIGVFHRLPFVSVINAF